MIRCCSVSMGAAVAQGDRHTEPKAMLQLTHYHRCMDAGLWHTKKETIHMVRCISSISWKALFNN